MKEFKQIWLVLLTLIILLAMIVVNYSKSKLESKSYMPSLPRPIAEEMLLITSAGQSTDTYIIKDIANKLMIHNYFMPQSTDLDLEDIKSIAFVVGYSEIGETLHRITIKEELERVRSLLELARKNDITLITFYIGGKQRRSKETELLLTEIGVQSDYIISTTDGDFDNFISKLAEENNIPITLVNEITDISEPFASAFR